MKSFLYFINSNGTAVDCSRYSTYSALGSAIQSSGMTARTYYNRLKERSLELERKAQGQNFINEMHILPLGKSAVGVIVQVAGVCNRDTARKMLKDSGIHLDLWA